MTNGQRIDDLERRVARIEHAVDVACGTAAAVALLVAAVCPAARSGARGWVDAIIDPLETRAILIDALDVATRTRTTAGVPVGVFQV